MSTSIFLWSQGERESEAGWRRNGYPHFDRVASGHHLAHDCLEHLPGGLRHGHVADELMALGARMYIRVESGWWTAHPSSLSVREQFGWELFYLFQAMAEEGVHEPRPIKTPPCPLANARAEKDIAAAFDHALHLGLNYGGKHWPDLRLFRAQFSGWIRRGWNACVSRYDGRAARELMAFSEQLACAYVRGSWDVEDERSALQVLVDERALSFELLLVPLTGALRRQLAMAAGRR